ncbi:MAG: phenylalanine--tRNA ligase subunit beta [Endomicrobiales bacterium]
MKISYNWLKEFVEFNQTPDELAALLFSLGLETTVISKSGGWEQVITAKVLEVSKHPQADRLSLCKVTDGTNTYSVVCGAPNVAAGQTVPLARIGASLPGGFKIKKAKIRGVESEGMICSEKELGLSNESSGIMVLPDSTPVGRPLEEVVGESDAVLEVEITTNRPDCLSHWGVAREIGARLQKNVRLPEIPRPGVSGTVPVTIKDPELCPRYIGCGITGVTVQPSPAWIARRLEKCGVRPINNIVDITNYVLLELGHPLHAFDTAAMAGGEIVVRRAGKDEKILALDGREYALSDSMLVIADREKPRAIAGVMGGEDSGVTEKTRNIILESAVFAPASIRRTSKTLSLSTDASYRFERGTGWTVAETASWRAADLIRQLAGGAVETRTDRYEKTYTPRTIELRPERVKRILGIDVPRAEIKLLLESLGMRTSENGGALRAEIPSWRLDLRQEIDLVEEVARLKGYENVPVTVLPITPSLKEGKKQEPIGGLLRGRMAGLGFCEVVNYSFAEERELSYFNLPAPCRIANPLSKENEVLRSDLLPGLWKNLILNLGQGYDDVKLFETGTIFTPQGEKDSFAFIVRGRIWPEWWKWEGKDVPSTLDFYFLSGLLNYLLCSDGANKGKLKITGNKAPSPYYHPGKTAVVELDGAAVGEFGVLGPRYTNEIGEAGYCTLALGELDRRWNRETSVYEPLRRHPPVKRDLSLVAAKDMPFEKISGVLNRFIGKGELLQEFELFSVYDRLGTDKISYSLHLIFRHPEHTLTDTEVNAQVDALVRLLNTELGITLR